MSGAVRRSGWRGGAVAALVGALLLVALTPLGGRLSGGAHRPEMARAAAGEPSGMLQLAQRLRRGPAEEEKPAEAQPEITEVVTSARPSLNMPGKTPTPSLNKKPKTKPTTTIESTAGEKKATRSK